MKFTKLVSMLLCSAMSINFIGVVNADAAAIRGDLNHDDQLNLSDLDVLQDYLLHVSSLPASDGAAADMTDDKIVNAYDAAAMRSMIIELNRNLKYTLISDKYTSGFKDTVKDNSAFAAISSTAELQQFLGKFLDDSLISNYTKKYDTAFFNKSVLLMKPVYAVPTVKKPEKYSGFSESFAGIYKTNGVYTYLNLRSEPNTNCSIVGEIYPGDKITVYYGNGAWAQVEHKGKFGFASMQYLQKVSDPEPVYAPDTSIKGVSYNNKKIEVELSSTNGEYSGFPLKVLQAIISRDDYYAESVSCGTTATTAATQPATTTTTVTTTAKPATTTVTTTTMSAAQRYPLAAKELEKVGKDLRSAFNAAVGITYYGHTNDMPQDDKTSMEWYADYGFKNRKGNCYVMAAMFCEMARVLGYEAHQISGRVPLRAGGYGAHSWVEVKIGDTFYVFDPDFQNENPDKNGYQIYYGQSGTWKYEKLSVMS